MLWAGVGLVEPMLYSTNPTHTTYSQEFLANEKRERGEVVG